ncbi:hypothetical protein [Demequina sp. NBRC 110053]|uniref:hypothetical protein n=1 Tax=Demequina sp. NBRC 110053 TaxID=1570342 RepID=UPI000A03518D|nr:hypothetical protein [Demequina sp. NBRC 110053]
MSATQGLTCGVHPHGFHDRRRARTRDDRVIVDGSIVGLARRCTVLEAELEESGRIEELRRHLWVLERTGRPLATLAVLIGALVGFSVAALGAVAGAADEGWGAPAVGFIVGAILALAFDRWSAAVHKERLRRSYEWRQYVGFQA